MLGAMSGSVTYMLLLSSPNLFRGLGKAHIIQGIQMLLREECIFQQRVPEKHTASSALNTPVQLFIENAFLRVFFFFFPFSNITIVIIQLYNYNRWLLEAF